MIVYEVIKDCSISYTVDGEDNGFALYKGDFFFINPDFCWVKREKFPSSYTKENVLVKIYHNKLLHFGDKPEDTRYEWTWIENINIVNPIINKNVTLDNFDIVNPFTGLPTCKNVTEQWEREDKLNLLLNSL
jgi:hypothetical protein